jgi:methylthioribulose 1-phosphate dehydratase/enolase-phosphatase E1
MFIRDSAVCFGSAAAPAARPAASRRVAAFVQALMDVTSKATALKSLQGRVWRDGYESGALRGHVFADTPAALRVWASLGKRCYIYSSGSREAQRLLFKHSAAGDLRALLSGYFDTRVGPKVEARSYADIALSLGVDAPARVLFLTDSLAEAVAARAAGMRAVLTLRPGNLALPPAAEHGFCEAASLRDVAEAAEPEHAPAAAS